MNEHMKLLGFKVRDVVTGFTGVVSSISFDLYGCVQAVVSPAINEKGEIKEGRWFNTKRLEITEGTPVLVAPTFETIPGGDVLPSQDRY